MGWKEAAARWVAPEGPGRTSIAGCINVWGTARRRAGALSLRDPPSSIRKLPHGLKRFSLASTASATPAAFHCPVHAVTALYLESGEGHETNQADCSVVSELEQKFSPCHSNSQFFLLSESGQKVTKRGVLPAFWVATTRLCG